jgi:hypothetical protein
VGECCQVSTGPELKKEKKGKEKKKRPGAVAEAETRRITVQSQPRQTVQTTYLGKKKKITRKGWWSGSR